jgi:hypothetical protein
LPRRPATAKTYTSTTYDVRKRTFVLGTGDLTNVATALPVLDASQFQVGDVLELNDGTNVERVEVTAAPSLSPTPNTVTIRRAREGTTAHAFLTATPTNVYLIGNSRTGTEVDQQAIRSIRTGFLQIVQTFQIPVQIGGEADAISNVPLPTGFARLFDVEKATKLIEMMRDIEYTSYYGMGEVPAAEGDRGKQKGLKTWISAYNGGANVTTSTKTNYTLAQFLADGIQKVYNAGGAPDLILCSTDFLGFLRTWAPSVTAIMGQNLTQTLGLPIREFVLPLNAEPLTFVTSLQLRPGTAVVLSSNDVDMRVLREEYFQPRGNRGDAIEGDWFASMCINLGHPQWGAWVEGVQSAA